MESSTPAAPDLPHEKLLSSLASYFCNERMVRALQRELNFVRLEFRTHQINVVKNFSPREANQLLSINQLSRAFWCPPSRVKAALANGREPPKSADVILPLMKVQKPEFWNGSKHEQGNVIL
jgi:hypothetical protein